MRFFAALLLLAIPSPILEAQTMDDRLEPLSPGSTTQYAFAVEIAGNFAFVGDPEDNGSRGAVLVYRRNDDDSWSLQRKLTAPGAQPGDEFGFSLGADGRYLIVGARLVDTIFGVNSGAAYVYDLTQPTMAPATLLPDALFGSTGDQFGYAVDVLDASPPRAIVGAQVDDFNGFTNNGSVAFFHFRNGAWSHQNTVGSPAGHNAEFGTAVSITENSIGVEAMIGAPQENGSRGVVYFYHLVFPGAWTQNSRLPDPSGTSSARYGFSVALDGEFAIAGAFAADLGAVNNGAAYIYERIPNGHWPAPGSWQHRIGATHGNDHVGISVDIKEAPQLANVDVRAAIGAYLDDGRGLDSGTVHTTERANGGVWTNVELLPVYGKSHDWFGRSVALDSSTAATRMIGGGPNGDMAQIFNLDRPPTNFIGRVSVSPQQTLVVNTFRSHGSSTQHKVNILWDVRSGNAPYRGCTTALRMARLLNLQPLIPDNFGEVIYTLTIPPKAAGRAVIFQAAELDLGNACVAISNPIEAMF